MGQIIGGFVLPHDPMVFGGRTEGQSEQRARIMAAYAEVRDRIGKAAATTVIIVGSDHYVIFGPTCLPAMLIGIGDVAGPYEKFPEMEQGAIVNNEPLALHILQHGRSAGLDWAASRTLTVDHSIGGPARLCALPNPTVKGVIPIYLASGVEPVISKRRAFQVGQAIRAAVEDWPKDERVVIVGSGGISHWVGLPQMGRVNEDFDRMVLDCVVRGDAERLIALDDAYVLDQAGNGAFEIRNFICAMGAAAGRAGEVIAYERGKEWVAGLGFAELKVAA